MKKIPLGPNTQKEGVCFLNNDEVIISDEYIRRFDLGGKLYTLDLKPYFDYNVLWKQKTTPFSVVF